MTTRSDQASPSRGIDWLLTTGVVAVAALYVRVFAFTPNEASQGMAQKILYLHATSAFVALYLGFALMAVTSGLYLFLKDGKLDLVAESAAEVGLVFTTVVLITGPLWGKPIWGDVLYGSERPFPVGIALHARTLTFDHPVLHRPVTVMAELPEAWTKAGIMLSAS